MGKELIGNIPTRKAAVAAGAEAPRAPRASVTPLVRGAIDAVYADDELYDEFMGFFDDKENSITGSKRVDLYYASEALTRIPCASSAELNALLEAKSIKLIDIAKRIVPELRKRNMDVRGNVCVGLLTAQ